MRELSLHILDIVENALKAEATRIALTVIEDLAANTLVIAVQDDGRGMDAETIRKVSAPRFTMPAAPRRGMGLPLFAAAVERGAGELVITTAPGQGTTITATLPHNHPNRAPLGNMISTLMCVLVYTKEFDLHYTHRVGSRVFEFRTEEIKQKLEDVPLSHPAVRRWLQEFIINGEGYLLDK